MIHNILLLTPMYPAYDMPHVDTNVIHYFAKEWINTGFNVLVVHYPVNFTGIVYSLVRPFREQIGRLTGGPIRTEATTESSYVYEGVQVKRIPLLKYRPHTRYSKKQINMAISKTIQFCQETAFAPDVIISHFINPQMEIMYRLKQYYKVSTCYVSHDSGADLKGIYKREASLFLSSIDVFGYRSPSIKRDFSSYFHLAERPSFLCYSGIPSDFLSNQIIERSFDKVCRFIFVGSLVKLKNPSTIVPAVSHIYKNEDFEIKYVGTGAEQKNIIKEADKAGVRDKVRLMGRMERAKIANELDRSDVFIMISKSEAFGLVYLEAMSRGCITVASKGTGFDGIIEHGVNGFLCEAGNVKELAEIVRQIKETPSDELQRISLNAMETAKRMTDKQVAKDYIKNVIHLIKTND